MTLSEELTFTQDVNESYLMSFSEDFGVTKELDKTSRLSQSLLFQMSEVMIETTQFWETLNMSKSEYLLVSREASVSKLQTKSEDQSQSDHFTESSLFLLSEWTLHFTESRGIFESGEASGSGYFTKSEALTETDDSKQSSLGSGSMVVIYSKHISQSMWISDSIELARSEFVTKSEQFTGTSEFEQTYLGNETAFGTASQDIQQSAPIRDSGEFKSNEFLTSGEPTETNHFHQYSSVTQTLSLTASNTVLDSERLKESERFYETKLCERTISFMATGGFIVSEQQLAIMHLSNTAHGSESDEFQVTADDTFSLGVSPSQHFISSIPGSGSKNLSISIDAFHLTMKMSNSFLFGESLDLSRTGKSPFELMGEFSRSSDLAMSDPESFSQLLSKEQIDQFTETVNVGYSEKFLSTSVVTHSPEFSVTNAGKSDMQDNSLSGVLNEVSDSGWKSVNVSWIATSMDVEGMANAKKVVVRKEGSVFGVLAAICLAITFDLVLFARLLYVETVMRGIDWDLKMLEIQTESGQKKLDTIP
jgi:hypothetical protein